jgi:hypothetical protein
MSYLLPFHVNGNKDKTVCSLNIHRRVVSGATNTDQAIRSDQSGDQEFSAHLRRPSSFGLSSTISRRT